MSPHRSETGKAGSGPEPRSPFQVPNVRLFVAFRALFNGRFYYPVFTVFFLDLGLSLSQFALLNAVWAAAIVLLEVPSGAMADVVGRRNLLILSGALMVLEMGLLAAAPVGGGATLFAILLVNRVLSGTAEAAASGADEALAYDSLCKDACQDRWGRVLEVQMQVQSLTYIAVLSIGAAVYDPVAVGAVLRRVGWDLPVTQAETLKLPVYLTLGMAVGALGAAVGMKETSGLTRSDWRGAVGKAFRLTFQAGGWILRTPAALVIILAGMLFDHVIRMFLTLNSQYYRMIGFPEATFGIVGAGLALMGVAVPGLARRMAGRFPPTVNLGAVAALTLAGLMGLTLFLPVVGLVPVVLLMAAFHSSRFLSSHYLNRITDSHQRATVLSFRGLCDNLAYGTVGVLYALLLKYLRSRDATEGLTAPDGAVNLVFRQSMGWFPWYFGVLLAALLVFAWWRLRPGAAGKSQLEKTEG